LCKMFSTKSELQTNDNTKASTAKPKVDKFIKVGYRGYGSGIELPRVASKGSDKIVK
jgi:hypothetical protein